MTDYERMLQHKAQRYTGERLELQWVERKLARQTRHDGKALRALCKQYSGHREYHVRVRLCTGTQFTDVQPTGDPEVFTGRRYPCNALRTVDGEQCGHVGTFRISKVAEFYACKKTSVIGGK